MYKFSFESTFENKKELEDEIKNLLWQIQRTWPFHLSNKNMTDTDQAWVKLNGGSRRQKTEETKIKISNNNPLKDKTIYTFIHSIYGIEICDKFQLIKKYKLDPSKMRKLVKHRNGVKSHLGWTLKTVNNE